MGRRRASPRAPRASRFRSPSRWLERIAIRRREGRLMVEVSRGNGLAAAVAEVAGPPTSLEWELGAVTVGPDDPRYAELTVGDNQRWVARPDYVRVVGSTDHVVHAVQEAVRSGRRLSIRGGGHCFADFVYNPDVKVVIDMSGMTGVRYDRRRRAFEVEAGAQLLHV